ncbi:MAG: HlyD family secretion protein [Planctomycetota bacterium]
MQSRLVNLAPNVPGQIVEVFVEERQWIRWGTKLAKIDPTVYQRALEIAEAKWSAAKADLLTEESALAKLEAQVPLQIAIAEQLAAIAGDDLRKATRALDLTTQDVDKQIVAAHAEVDSARAVFVNAEEDYVRYSNLFQKQSVPLRRFEEATKVFKTAEADVHYTEARLAQAQAAKNQIQIAEEQRRSAERQTLRATEALNLAKVGRIEIEESRRRVAFKRSLVEQASRERDLAQANLDYTDLKAPFDGIVVKRYRSLGDYAAAGAPILTVFDPKLVYITANLEETRLRGVAPGNRVDITIDAFDEPFRGRVIWVGSATGANFSLIPRDVSSGEFTKIVQRVPVRIGIAKDSRWDQLKPGLSATVAIEHGPGDPDWAKKAAEEEIQIETIPGPTP